VSGLRSVTLTVRFLCELAMLAALGYWGLTVGDVAWCGDVTWIPTDEGWLYLASVIDLASRHLVGWSMGHHHDAALVTGALDAAVATRGRHRMDATIFHTDRGSEPGFKGSSQRRLVGWRVAARSGLRLGSSNPGSCGAGC
jgi:transposase InsO family protein